MNKNIFNTFLVKLMSSVGNLVITIILSRFLGAEVKGEQGLFLTIVSLTHIVMGVVGLGSLMYLIPRLSYLQLLIPSYLWTILVAIITYFVLPLLYPELSTYCLHICLLSVLITVYNIHLSSIMAHERIVLANKISLFQLCLLISSLLFFVFWGNMKTLTAYIYAMYVSYLVSLAICYAISFGIFNFSFSNQNFKSLYLGFTQLFRFGIFNQLDVFAQLLSFRISYFILAHNVGNKEVGVFSVAVSIAESVWLISRSVSLVNHVSVINTNDSKTNTKRTLQYIQKTFLLTLIALLALIVIPNNFYSYLFGKDFSDVRMSIISLLPGIAFFSISFVISGLFSGQGYQKINSIASIVGLFAAIASAYIVIPLYGVIGAGISASISYTVTSIIKVYYFSKKYNVTWKDYFAFKMA